MPDHPTPQTPDDFIKVLRAGHFDAIADQVEPIFRSASAHPHAIRDQAERLAAVLKRDVHVHDEPYGLTWTNGQGTQVLVALPVPLPDAPPDELDEAPELADESEPEDAPVDEALDEPEADEPDDEASDDDASDEDASDEDASDESDEPSAEALAPDAPEADEVAADDPAPEAPEAPVDPDGVGSGRFFRGGARLTSHGPVTLVIAREGGEDDDPLLRATLIPTAGSDEHKAFAQPFTVVATASELDAGFLDLIGAAVDGNRGIQTALAELKAAKDAEKASQKAAAAATKNKANKSAAKAAPAKPAEPTPPKEPPAPSLFPPAN